MIYTVRDRETMRRKESEMTTKMTGGDDSGGLHKETERVAQRKADLIQGGPEAMSPEETRQILYELRVHQIELEMQNEELRRTHTELEASRARYLDLYDMAPVGYVTLSKKGLILETNLTGSTLLGVRKVDLVGQPLSRFIFKEEQDGYYLHLRQLFDTGEPQAWALRMVKKNGTAFWAHLEATASLDNDGSPVCLIAVIDITAHKRAEKTLLESEERYRFLVRNTSDYVARYTPTGELLFASEAIRFMLGYNPEEIIGTSGLNRVHPDDRPIAQEALKKVSEMEVGTDAKVEYRAICHDGSYKWVESSGKTVRNNQADRMEIIATVRDITERKHLEEELREASLHDLLTGLYNRRGFFALAEQQVRAATRARMKLILTYFDCDDFKWINDSLGHEQGDMVLADTAHILRQTFRGSDIVARIGGDEFVVLSIEGTEIDPIVFLKRLQKNIDEYNAKEARRYKLALSWGTVVYDPEAPDSLDVLLSKADRLMYVHKKDKENLKS